MYTIHATEFQFNDAINYFVNRLYLQHISVIKNSCDLYSITKHLKNAYYNVILLSLSSIRSPPDFNMYRKSFLVLIKKR